MPRLEQIQKMLQAEPDDVFLNFGLAMEYMRTGQLEQALDQFQHVIELDGSYTTAYFQKANTLVSLDRREEAREALTAGIEAARRSGDHHAAAEMSEALALIR